MGTVLVLWMGYSFFFGNPSKPLLSGGAAAAVSSLQAAPETTESSSSQMGAAGNTTNNQTIFMSATLRTNKGDITVEFLPETAPNTVANFEKLARQGFYDGTKFHRVIKGFMIQGGDPLSKDDSQMARWGTGGPGYSFNDELSGKEKYPQGTLAMANAGPNTNGSQFFIVTASPEAPLPPNYTVFGKVTAGMDAALAIENVKTYQPGQVDRPLDPVVIEKITLK